MDQNRNGIPLYFLIILFLGITLGISAYWFLSAPKSSLPIPIAQNQDANNQPMITPTEKIITLTPTPRPTGPGPYACSIGGDCKHWNEQIQKENCTTTFADSNCLDQCTDTTKRCKI